jgi:hypothetical protein
VHQVACHESLRLGAPGANDDTHDTVFYWPKSRASGESTDAVCEMQLLRSVAPNADRASGFSDLGVRQISLTSSARQVDGA